MRVALLVLLCACLAACSSTSTPAPAAAARSTRTLHVVGLGDSVMAGTNCDCDGIVEEYADALGRRTHDRVDSTNLAANGLVTGDVLEDLLGSGKHRAAVRDADVVLVTIGANDLLPQFAKWQESSCSGECYLEPAREMGRNLSRVLDVVDRLRHGHPGAVLVTDYWNVFTDGDVARQSGGQAQVDWSSKVTAAANSAICRAVRAHDATCVDLVQAFKGSGSDPTPLLADDGDHPNAAGVRVIVRRLMAKTPRL